MKKKMRVLLAAAFAGVLALGLVGCSGGSGSGDGEGGSETANLRFMTGGE